MESLKCFHDHLEDLQRQAKTLTSTGLSLIALFTEEAKRIDREDEASCLRALFNAIAEDLKRMKSNESSTSYAHSKVNLVVSWGTLGAAAFMAMVSNDNRLSGILLRSLDYKEKPPFGNVLVCIGPEGLPDDVKVVSVSGLARESNRLESEVINELGEQGYLLFSEEVFSLLIDKLAEAVREGRLRLPISRGNCHRSHYRRVET